MKTEPKAFASLSSGLLARKGAARPAMKPQGFGQMGSGMDDLGWNDMGFEPPKPTLTPVRDADHDAFGEEVGEERRYGLGLTPVSPVHHQQAEIKDRFNGDSEDEEIDETAEIFEPEVDVENVAPVSIAAAVVPIAAAPRRASKPRSAVGAKGKAAFTLRLDADRHLKLRLACAVTAKSAQQLVTSALDTLLASMPQLDAMAEKAPERAVRKG